MPSKRPMRCRYEPETALLSTEQMRPIEELGYRRIVDLILVSRNRLINDDVELARMTKCGNAWPEIKQRLVKNHKALYVDGTYLRSEATNGTWEAVERTTRQKSGAGKASAAKRQAKKDAAQAPVAAPMAPASAVTAPQQPLPEPPGTVAPRPLPDPPNDTAPEPAPMVNVPPVGITVATPINGNGAGDESTVPEREGTTISQDWQPSTEVLAFAAGRGYTPPEIAALVVEFVTNSRANGITSKDWNATFRMRVLRDLASNPRPDARQPMSA